MNRIAQHKILVSGDSFDLCCRQVLRFFDLTSLVIYDCIEVIDGESCSALDTIFHQTLLAAEQKNRESVASLIAELQQTGVQHITDLRHLVHGYPSKVLHVLSHFLDGFIGIDSFFYNLPDDSHWIGAATLAAIDAAPEKFWLIHIDCYAASLKEASLLHK
jgi:hypothetical protein